MRTRAIYVWTILSDFFFQYCETMVDVVIIIIFHDVWM